MSQRVSGLYSFLNISQIYTLFQNIFGNKQSLQFIVEEFIRPFPGCRVLDIGCGPASIVKFLPKDTIYQGFDANQDYIDTARRLHGVQGEFHCCLINDVKGLSKAFDIVIALGVLHHLDDLDAAELFRLAHNALIPNGRFISSDICFFEGQKMWARFLASMDRGKYVRTPQTYLGLSKRAFDNCSGSLIRAARIPITHWTMECIK